MVKIQGYDLHWDRWVNFVSLDQIYKDFSINRIKGIYLWNAEIS